VPVAVSPAQLPHVPAAERSRWTALWPILLVAATFFAYYLWWQYAFPVAAMIALAALWTVRRWSRAPLAAALFFVVTLFPALGFFNAYPFAYSFVADHFQYLAGL